MSSFQQRLLFDGGIYRRAKHTKDQSMGLFLNNMRKRGYDADTAHNYWIAEEGRKRRINNLNKLKRYKGYSDLSGYKNSWTIFLSQHPYSRNKYGNYKNYLIQMKSLRGQRTTVTHTTPELIREIVTPRVTIPVDQAFWAEQLRQYKPRESVMQRVSREANEILERERKYKEELAIKTEKEAEKIRNMERFMEEQRKQLEERRGNLQLALMNPRRISGTETSEDKELYTTAKVKELIKLLNNNQLMQIAQLPIESKLSKLMSMSDIPKSVYSAMIQNLTPQEKAETDKALTDLIVDIKKEKKYTKAEVERMKMAYYPRQPKEAYAKYKHRLVALPMPPTIEGQGFFMPRHMLTNAIRYMV